MEIEMQGLWKEKLGGWNHKDSKRKTQNRNHYFKAKFKAYLNVSKRKDKTISTDKYNIENLIEITKIFDNYNHNYIKEKAVIYLAKISYIPEQRSWKPNFNKRITIIEKVYFEDFNHCYVYNKNKLELELGLDKLYKSGYCNLITEFKVKIELIKIVDIITWDVDNQERFLKDIDVWESTNSYETFHKKRVPVFKADIIRKNYENNKYKQELTNSKRRIAENKYISNADFDKDIDFRIYYGWYDYY